MQGHKRLICGLDIAFDFPLEQSQVVCVSLTGKSQDRRKGTLYYGERNNDSYLKIYDKKKELKQKQKIDIDQEALTRIEYSFRYSDGLLINDITRIPFKIAQYYTFSLLDISKVSGTLKACVLAYTNGHMDLKEFPRRTKESIKKPCQK